ncbi:glycoside hydrolase family 10 [Nibricoccus aquaticus]|uniref:Beta-xylanase n=1 Tax=Nibricoccus aquaticus TaxID=2576891 RepID=A0A290Q557_9BACT|nr:endo-1,4-beta-xylanase [Nibricoccus aquaticus]ATC63819.1 glycoside hydrolase family 10 [Nibricoccus aquaticus]
MKRILLLIPLLLAAAIAQAQTLLPKGDSLLAGDPVNAFALRVEPHAKDNVKFETVDLAGPGFTRGWRVATLQDTSPMAAIELRGVNSRPVVAGEVALMRFFARATEISDETGAARVLLFIRRNGVDWNSSFEGDFPITREWQEILVPFVWTQDFDKDGAAFMLRFGFKRQTVEIGGVEVIHYGKTQTWAELPRTKFSYKGREADAAWRKAAFGRIEKIRKGDFAINVVDAAGKPVSDAKVVVTQTRAAFQWGSALQMQRLVVDSPENRRYREITEELFNAAGPENDLKWPVWAGEWGAGFSQEQTLAGLRWLKERGFHTRGHVFVWPGHKNLPKPIQERIGTAKQNEIPEMVHAHIREIARATKGLLDEWDVLNEPFTNFDLMKIFGDEVMAPWFKVAREELPGVALYFNDFSNHDATTDADHVAHFEKTTRYLLDHGAPVDGLGMQVHFNGRPNAPENILAVLDRYQKQFALPVRMTEFDVWTMDEELQADFTRDFLILSFSHPSVVGVQHWGFWESTHWRPPAAMYRADWSEKPNARVYKDLVLKKWRTNLEGATDAGGRFAQRGFHGEYSVVVEAGGRRIEKTFSLTPAAGAAELTVTLP